MPKGSGNIAAIVEEVVKEFGDALKTGMSSVMGDVAKSAFLPLTPALAAFQVGADKTIQTMLAFVSKANPAAAFQFNRAMDDLAATMGQILVPVLEGVGIFVREMADVFQGLKPTLEPIMSGIREVIVELSKLIQPLMSLFVPALQIIGAIIKDVVVPAIKKMVEVFMELVKILQEAGLVGELQKGNSIGAAVRPAAYGSIEDIGKRTTLSALGKTDKNEQLNEQKKTNEILGKIDKNTERNGNKGKEPSIVDMGLFPGLSVARWAARQFD